MTDRTFSGFSSGAPIGLRELLEATPDMVFCCDQSGRFQWLNAPVESQTGLPMAHPLGQPFTDILAPESRSAAQFTADFLSSLSHEIRTPMSGILGMSQMLLESNLDPHQKGLIETLQTSSQALLTLVNDTLDFVAIEAGSCGVEMFDF